MHCCECFPTSFQHDIVSYFMLSNMRRTVGSNTRQTLLLLADGRNVAREDRAIRMTFAGAHMRARQRPSRPA
jgi:hypothetical protein